MMHGVTTKKMGPEKLSRNVRNKTAVLRCVTSQKSAGFILYLLFAQLFYLARLRKFNRPLIKKKSLLDTTST